MGRVRFNENNSNCLTGKEDLTKSSNPIKSRRKIPRKYKENIRVGLHENNEIPSTNDCSTRSALSDKTNSVLNKITSEKKNTRIEKGSNLLWDEKIIDRPHTNLKNSKKPSTSIEPCYVNLNECAVNESKAVNGISKSENKHVIPIYKQNENVSKAKKVSLPVEEKLALYEFNEIDDSDESSAIKKKKKKRKYNKKTMYKIGPKYLTVNNIKFSSSESINSLTDKLLPKKSCAYPSKQKQKITAVKRQSQSMVNLNDSTNTCVSVSSCKSQPLLQTSCHDSDNSHIDLSIINENDVSNTSSQVKIVNNNFYTDVHMQNSSHLPYTAKTDSEDLCSSTPCKTKASLNNSNNFSFASVHSGEWKKNSHEWVVGRGESSDDEFYGFEEKPDEQCQEPCNFSFVNKEELNETLLSPVKKPSESCNFGFDDDEILEDSVKECSDTGNVSSDIDRRAELPPLLSVREIVQLLQAEQNEDETTNTANEESTVVEPDVTIPDTNVAVADDDIVCTFTKPSRRSYQRQSLHRYSIIEKEHENNEEEHTVPETKQLHPKRKPKCKGKKEVLKPLWLCCHSYNYIFSITRITTSKKQFFTLFLDISLPPVFSIVFGS